MSITTSPTIVAISAALLKFQGVVEGVGRTADNSAFKKDGKALKYATLENVRDTAVPELQKVGVLFMQSGGAIVEGVMAMTTRLIHAESGEWIEGTMDIALGKRDPQGVGSAQTYAQRYHLMAMLGLPPVDDDGEAAIDRDNKRPAVVNAPAKSSAQAKREDLWPQLIAEVDACPNLEELERLLHSKPWQDTVKPLPRKWIDELRDYVQETRDAFAAVSAPGKFIPPNFDKLEGAPQ